jgi:hypothetical protein
VAWAKKARLPLKAKASKSAFSSHTAAWGNLKAAVLFLESR